MLRGTLYYERDSTLSTAGNYVWVRVKGDTTVGVAVVVRDDNTWTYRPSDTTGTGTWASHLPPLKSSRRNEAEPVLLIDALVPPDRTKVVEVRWSTHKRREIQLLLEALPSPVEIQEIEMELNRRVKKLDRVPPGANIPVG
jgi:hypothetical protein